MTIWGDRAASYTDRTQCQQSSEDNMNKNGFFAVAAFVSAMAAPIGSLAAGIVASIDKAPVIADGNGNVLVDLFELDPNVLGV